MMQVLGSSFRSENERAAWCLLRSWLHFLVNDLNASAQCLCFALDAARGSDSYVHVDQAFDAVYRADEEYHRC